MPAKVICWPIFKQHLIKKKPGTIIVSTVAKAGSWKSELSPFILGPCKLYGIYKSKNMENGWQFSKVYPEHVGADGGPNYAYFAWAATGWIDDRAHRYPMGKGRKPLYSWWDGEALDYIDARKVIYGPLYIRAVFNTLAMHMLDDVYREAKRVYLLDYDVRDIRQTGETLTDVVNNPHKKMGHAFLLKMMLEGDRALSLFKVW